MWISKHRFERLEFRVKELENTKVQTWDVVHPASNANCYNSEWASLYEIIQSMLKHCGLEVVGRETKPASVRAVEK